MSSSAAVLKRRVLKRVAPIVFVALAGIGLAACGSSAAKPGMGGQHNTTTIPPSNGGTSF